MTADSGRVDSTDELPYRVGFFAPDRPVEGGTVYVRDVPRESGPTPPTPPEN